MRKLALILSVILLAACQKQQLYCSVTLQLESEEPIVALTIDNSLPGNYFRNLNTGEQYQYPVFVNGKCELQVLKGIYVLSFDGVAASAEGKARKVRMTKYATTLDAVQLTEDQATITLPLVNLQ